MIGTSLEIVVARYREPLDWLPTFLKLGGALGLPISAVVYDKGGGARESLDAPGVTVEVIELPNVGREAHTYLHHLTTRREDLAEITLCLQGRPGDHVPAGRLAMAFEWAQTIDPEESAYLALGPWRYCDELGNPHNGGLPVGEFSTALFDRPAPLAFKFTPGAQFGVTRGAICRRKPEFYTRALELCNSEERAPWCYERLWAEIFAGRIG